MVREEKIKRMREVLVLGKVIGIIQSYSGHTGLFYRMRKDRISIYRHELPLEYRFKHHDYWLPTHETVEELWLCGWRIIEGED